MSRPDEISETIRRALDRCFRDLDGELPSGIYDMVLKTVERPMLETVMRQADGNQTLAAEMLGINRNTLRKKLNDHQLLD